METLAIIAYRQPVTRGDIEDIRGVAVSTHIIQTLETARLDRRRRPPRNAGPAGALRHHDEDSSTTSACARWRSCRRSRKSPRPSSSRWFPLPKRRRPRSRSRQPSEADPQTATAPTGYPTAERLQKLLAAAGLGSRREIESWIEAGRVTRQRPGREARRPGDASATRSWWTASPSQLQKTRSPRVLLYHKPVGELVTRSDPEGRPTVFEQPAAGPLGCGGQAGPQQLRASAADRLGRAGQPPDASALRPRARVPRPGPRGIARDEERQLLPRHPAGRGSGARSSACGAIGESEGTQPVVPRGAERGAQPRGEAPVRGARPSRSAGWSACVTDRSSCPRIWRPRSAASFRIAESGYTSKALEHLIFWWILGCSRWASAHFLFEPRKSDRAGGEPAWGTSWSTCRRRTAGACCACSSTSPGASRSRIARAVSRHLTRVFAVEGIDYERLEVSSPGLDRPLRKGGRFRALRGPEGEVRMRTPDATGRRRFEGRAAGRRTARPRRDRTGRADSGAGARRHRPGAAGAGTVRLESSE